MSSSVITRKARFWPEIPHEQAQLVATPQAPAQPNAFTLTPMIFGIVGVAASAILFALLSKGTNPLYFLGFVALSGFSFAGSLLSYRYQRRNARKVIAELGERYRKKLTASEQYLSTLQISEERGRLEIDPPLFAAGAGVAPIIKRPLQNSDLLLWSRSPTDPDFLAARFGVGLCPATFSVEGPQSQDHIALESPFQTEDDYARQLLARFATVTAPVTVKLQHDGPVAIVASAGNPQSMAQAREIAHTIVAQLVYHHSPDDVRVIILAPDAQAAAWQWTKRLPHTIEYSSNDTGGDPYDPQRPHAEALGREAILRRLPLISRELGRREVLVGEEGQTNTAAPLPRLIIIVDHFDPASDLDGPATSLPRSLPQGTAPAPSSGSPRARLTETPLRHAELSLALNRGRQLGVSVVCVCAQRADAPMAAQTVIDLDQGRAATTGALPAPPRMVAPHQGNYPIPTGTLPIVTAPLLARVRRLLPDPGYAQGCSHLDAAPQPDLRAFADRISALRPANNKRPELRTQIDLRQLFDPALNLASYDPARFWRDPDMRANILAPGTGTQMRLPIGQKIGEETQYLDIVRDGPHGLLIGQTGSGKSELLQTMIASLALLYPPTEVNFLLIDYKAGLALEPFRALPHTIGFLSNVSQPSQIRRFITMLGAEATRREELHRAGKTAPRLLIIIDEFAEMVKRTESVLDELFTITRVGRAIGMHLLLSAQRPEGIIGTKVRDYVQYRLCLRVASPEDSREVLGRVDAANLPAAIPGRGFFLHGDNQLELFQAARVMIPANPL